MYTMITTMTVSQWKYEKSDLERDGTCDEKLADKDSSFWSRCCVHTMLI